MTCITTAEICVPQHDALEVFIDVTDQDGALVDISTASEITFEVAAEVTSVTPEFAKTLSGSTLSMQSSSRILVPLEPADTGLAAATYYYELRIVNVAGDPATVLKGAFVVEDTMIGD